MEAPFKPLEADLGDDTICVTIRLLFKGNQVGTLIGRKGSKIMQIREESACEVKIKGNEKDIERIVSVSGSPAGVTRAIGKVGEFVEADLNDGLTGRTTKIPVTLHMIVPTGQCGSIIGKGGFRIKEIREKTGCNVKIANDLLPGSTEKLITLYGEPHVIEQCVGSICQVMIEEGQERKCTPYIPASFGPSPVFGMEGMPRAAQYPTPAAPAFPYPGHAGAPPTAPPPGQVGYPPNWTPGPPMPNQQIRAPAYNQAYGQGYSQPNDPGFILQDTNLDHFKVKLATKIIQDGVVEVHVDKTCMGAVIGRGGSRISEVRMLSTHDIKIHEVDGESTFRRISVSGQKELVDKAILLLHVCVNVFTEPKDKVGHLSLLQAVQYAQGGLKGAAVEMLKYEQQVKGEVVDAHQQALAAGFHQQAPYGMDYGYGYAAGHPHQPPAPRSFRMPFNGRGYNKKRPADNPAGMETGEGESEIPCNKREKFRQY